VKKMKLEKISALLIALIVVSITPATAQTISNQNSLLKNFSEINSKELDSEHYSALNKLNHEKVIQKVIYAKKLKYLTIFQNNESQKSIKTKNATANDKLLENSSLKDDLKEQKLTKINRTPHKSYGDQKGSKNQLSTLNSQSKVNETINTENSSTDGDLNSTVNHTKTFNVVEVSETDNKTLELSNENQTTANDTVNNGTQTNSSERDNTKTTDIAVISTSAVIGVTAVTGAIVASQAAAAATAAATTAISTVATATAGSLSGALVTGEMCTIILAEEAAVAVATTAATSAAATAATTAAEAAVVAATTASAVSAAAIVVAVVVVAVVVTACVCEILDLCGIPNPVSKAINRFFSFDWF
jgi:hypothetical protein